MYALWNMFTKLNNLMGFEQYFLILWGFEQYFVI